MCKTTIFTQLGWWPRIVLLLLASHLSFITSSAQTFTTQVQQQKKGEGKVTITQSKAIEDLVNGKKLVTTPPAPAATTPTAPVAKNDTVPTPTIPKPIEARPVTGEAPRQIIDENGETVTAPIDMSKKVPRHSYRINGFRVQAFAGGNSREDKLKAEQAGRSIKMKYPELPVYVHFYSPQWKCRVGNFKTYEEASRVLRNVKAMGYKQACIVKGKISVQY